MITNQAGGVSTNLPVNDDVDADGVVFIRKGQDDVGPVASVNTEVEGFAGAGATEHGARTLDFDVVVDDVQPSQRVGGPRNSCGGNLPIGYGGHEKACQW
jgi:hypothetical protein